MFQQDPWVICVHLEVEKGCSLTTSNEKETVCKVCDQCLEHTRCSVSAGLRRLVGLRCFPVYRVHLPLARLQLGGDGMPVPVLVAYTGPTGESQDEAPTMSTHPALPLPRHHGPHHPADVPRHR